MGVLAAGSGTGGSAAGTPPRSAEWDGDTDAVVPSSVGDDAAPPAKNNPGGPREERWLAIAGYRMHQAASGTSPARAVVDRIAG
ncbi:hypothetical protein [Arthrobacter sp. TMS1-12-1]